MHIGCCIGMPFANLLLTPVNLMRYTRYVIPKLLLCLILPVAVLLYTLEQPWTAHAPEIESAHRIVLVSDPGTPPGWAQTPSSTQGTRNNNQPPNEAGAPGLPGPPSMPLPGVVLLALAGGALACRRLRNTGNPSHQSSGTMSRIRHFFPLLLCFLLTMPMVAQAQRVVEWPSRNSMPSDRESRGVVFEYVGAGNTHSLAITEGAVWAWGQNHVGQANVPAALADPDHPDFIPAVQVDAGSTATLSHSVTLLEDGTVRAWGSGSVVSALPTMLVNSAHPDFVAVQQIAVGSNTGLARRADGTVVAWGGTTSINNVPVKLTNPATADVIQITTTQTTSGAGNTAIALRADGTVVVWGDNTVVTNNLPAVLADDGHPDFIEVAQIAAGQNVGLALRENGSVVAWGSGVGVTGLPARVSDPEHTDYVEVVQVRAGLNRGVALRSDNTLVAWGTDAGLLPAILTNPATAYVEQVSISHQYGYALRADGSLLGWGNNAQGQAGLPGVNYSVIDHIVVGGDHVLALLDDGTVAAWGNSAVYRNVPPELTNPATANVIQLSGGGDNLGLALRGDGTVRAWGTAGNIGGIVQLPGDLTDVRRIAAAGGFGNVGMAILNDGTVRAWGSGPAVNNLPGDLANVVELAVGGGLTTYAVALMEDGTVRAWGPNNATLEVPPDLRDVVQIAASSDGHVLALRDDGTVIAWGSGSGTNVPADLTDVVRIATGQNHSVAIRADGTVVTWEGSDGAHSIPPDLLDPETANAVYLAAGSGNNAVLIRRAEDPPPVIFVEVEANTETVTAGQMANFDLTFLNSDDETVNNVPIRVYVRNNAGDLVFEEFLTVNDGHVYTWQVPSTAEDGDLFDVRFRPEHPDYLYTLTRNVVLVLPFEFEHELTGSGAGWRMLSSPVLGTTVRDLTAVNLVRGLPDEYPGGDLNVYVGYMGNNSESDPHRGFIVPTGLNQPLEPGRGFIWYLFDATYNPPEQNGESESFPYPFNISFTGPLVVENLVVRFTYLNRSWGSGTDNWYLVGNPFTDAWDVSGLSVTRGTLSETVQHWDGTQYVPITGEVPVMAGFFAELAGAGSSNATFVFGPPESGRSAAERFTADFELTGELLVAYDGNQIPVEIRDHGHVVFSEDATDGHDRIDAGKLTPLSYYWANIAMMGSSDGEMVRRLIESRPLPDGPVTIPMTFSTYANGLEAAGEFTISLSNNALGDGWQVWLTDLATGDTVDMLAGSYMFAIDTQPAIEADERFTLTFIPPPVSGESSGESYVFGMEPVWPNPTISGSQVAFTLEEVGEISLEMFDVLGRRVMQVANSEYQAGRHVLPLSTDDLASGVYVVRLIAGSQTAVQRVTVAR